MNRWLFVGLDQNVYEEIVRLTLKIEKHTKTNINIAYLYIPTQVHTYTYVVYSLLLYTRKLLIILLK